MGCGARGVPAVLADARHHDGLFGYYRNCHGECGVTAGAVSVVGVVVAVPIVLVGLAHRLMRLAASPYQPMSARRVDRAATSNASHSRRERDHP